MRKKTGQFIAVLSAFMMAGGNSLMGGTIPVMAAETAVDATAELSNDALAAMQAQAAADAAASVQAAAAAGTDVQTVVAGLTDENAAGAAETDNSSAEAPAAGSTSSAEAGNAAAPAADTSGGSIAVSGSTGAAAESAATAAAVSGAAAGTESASAIAAGVAQSVSNLTAVSGQVQVTTENSVQAVHVSAPDNGWTGPVLTRRKGVNKGPSGKETYYNLNMSRVIATMRRLGFEGEYWVRDDGVKMFGQYIMVAADLKKHPRGSLVETSLGTGIVVDTGEFPRYGVAVDIAVTW